MPSIATEVDVTELAKHLCTRIPKLAEKAESTGAWTDAVYHAFSEYKEGKPGWNIYPGDKAKKGEYLCDFMLLEDGYGTRVACESQWWHSQWSHGQDEHSGKLEWSFDKLVGVKGDIKVFICEGDSQQWDQQWDQQWEKIRKDYLADYALLSPDEAFLTLRFDKSFQATWWKPSRPGVHKLEEITFKPINLSA